MAIHGRKIRPDEKREKKSSTQSNAMYALIKKKFEFHRKNQISRRKNPFQFSAIGQKSLHFFFHSTAKDYILVVCRAKPHPKNHFVCVCV